MTVLLTMEENSSRRPFCKERKSTLLTTTPKSEIVLQRRRGYIVRDAMSRSFLFSPQQYRVFSCQRKRRTKERKNVLFPFISCIHYGRLRSYQIPSFPDFQLSEMATTSFHRISPEEGQEKKVHPLHRDTFPTSPSTPLPLTS